jgi:hypothetical protein
MTSLSGREPFVHPGARKPPDLIIIAIVTRVVSRSSPPGWAEAVSSDEQYLLRGTKVSGAGQPSVGGACS